MAANPKFSASYVRNLYGALRGVEAPAPVVRNLRRGLTLAQMYAAAQRDLARIAQQLSASVAELIGPWRLRSIASKRHMAAWALRQAGYSFPTIGYVLRREHATIMYSVRQVDARREADGDFRCSTDALRARMEHAQRSELLRQDDAPH